MFEILMIILALILIVAFMKEVKKKKFEKMYKGFEFIHLRNGIIGWGDEYFMYVYGKKELSFRIRDIDHYEIYTNDKIVSKVKRTIAGGLVFGFAGALVGSMTGQGKVKHMGVILYINGDVVKLEFLLTQCKKQSFIAKQAEENIHQFIAQLKKAQ